MSLKEILVHLDNTPRCRTRLDVAIALAQKHGAHLTGLYAADSPYYSPDRANAEPAVGEAEALFREKTAGTGIGAHWVSAAAADPVVGVSQKVILHAYYADLVILGQSEPQAGQRSVPTDLPEQVVLGAGRPVLLVPYAGEFRTAGERVIVAWRGGKASSRALHDALPFLKEARKVNVVRVNPENAGGADENLRTYLTRHGIEALTDTIQSDHIGIGDVLLNLACDLSADLVVLGVLPSGRAGSVGLGPVARHFLDHMTLPVLMSG